MNPLFPQLLQFSDVALLCLRLMVATVFFTSGLQHARDPVGRAASIGLSPGVTRMLGFVEMAASLGVAFGVFTQLAALGLMVAHRFLGRQDVRVALRPDVSGRQSGDPDDRRRPARASLIRLRGNGPE